MAVEQLPPYEVVVQIRAIDLTGLPLTIEGTYRLAYAETIAAARRVAAEAAAVGKLANAAPDPRTDKDHPQHTHAPDRFDSGVGGWVCACGTALGRQEKVKVHPEGNIAPGHRGGVPTHLTVKKDTE